MKALNILNAALFKGQWRIMISKLFKRFFDNKSSMDESALNAWFEDNQADIASFCASLDVDLWEQIQTDIKKINDNAQQALSHITLDLGGGGAYPLLYFLVRLIKPEIVVETGVAAGFSSYSILGALEKNKKGQLLSSDFPYFRIKNPEKYIGIVVPDSLKQRWELFIDGDENNIPLIVSKISKVDLLHYDSDKSYSGRNFVLNLLEDKITADTWLIFDDIQDNSHFYDFIHQKAISSWKVFSFEGKWVGLIFPKNRD